MLELRRRKRRSPCLMTSPSSFFHPGVWCVCACVVKGRGWRRRGTRRGGGEAAVRSGHVAVSLRPTSFFKRLQLIRLGHRGTEAAA